MRSRNGMRPGSWSLVISVLLLVAGGAFLFYLGTVVGPAEKQNVLLVDEGSARYPIAERESPTLVPVASAGIGVGSETDSESSQLAQFKIESKSPISGVRTHGDLCGLPNSQVEQLLSQTHGSRPWESRYSWDYTWWNIKDLRQHFYDVPAKDVECLLVSVAGVIPCLAEECLLTLYVRPHTSDIEVVLQLFDKLEYYYLTDYTPTTILDAGGNVGFGALIFGTM